MQAEKPDLVLLEERLGVVAVLEEEEDIMVVAIMGMVTLDIRADSGE